MPTGLKELALHAVEIIEKDSEVKELWEEDEDWITEIKELKLRLKA